MVSKERPLISHVVYQLHIGGLENGLVNLLNRLPAERYRHIVVCLKDFSSFGKRIDQKDVKIVAMNRQDGRDPRLKLCLYQLFRSEKPDIVHTRNLPCLDALLPAALAGVPVRIHSEHGRNVDDADGSNRKHRLLRMLHRPFVHHYVAVSKDLQQYLIRRVRVSPSRISQIYNGVDTEKFRARVSRAGRRSDQDGEAVVIGSVLRFDPVKDPGNLVKAISLMIQQRRDLRRNIRLVMIGDGPVWPEIERQTRDSGIAELCWLPGARDDIPRLLRGMDLFVMPSLAEGNSNTILEAMATALPVVATQVGGNEEVVIDGRTGRLISAGKPDALMHALVEYVENPGLRLKHGQAGRERVKEAFSLDKMVQAYTETYDKLLCSV